MPLSLCFVMFWCICCCFLFLAHIPLFLYPFLHTVSKTRPFEYLRLTSLGVIGALVKVYKPRIVNHMCSENGKYKYNNGLHRAPDKIGF